MAIKSMNVNPKSFDRSQIKFYVILVPIAIVMLLPVIYIFSQAFKPNNELLMFPPTFFVQEPTLKNFLDLFRTASTTGVPLSRYLFNSVLISVVFITLTIIITVAVGYALSKKDFKGKDTMFKVNQLALMFVLTAVTIPRYLVIDTLGLTDTFMVHIIPYLAIPVGLFLIKQFIDGVPNELLEAARIDGANDFEIIWQIVVPLIKPAIATIAIISFQTIWNTTESSNLYIITETKKTFAFYLTVLTQANVNNIAGLGMSAAAGLILFIPNLVIFIIMQGNVMDTMSHSGIK